MDKKMENGKGTWNFGVPTGSKDGPPPTRASLGGSFLDP